MKRQFNIVDFMCTHMHSVLLLCRYLYNIYTCMHSGQNIIKLVITYLFGCDSFPLHWLRCNYMAFMNMSITKTLTYPSNLFQSIYRCPAWAEGQQAVGLSSLNSYACKRLHVISPTFVRPCVRPEMWDLG